MDLFRKAHCSDFHFDKPFFRLEGFQMTRDHTCRPVLTCPLVSVDLAGHRPPGGASSLLPPGSRTTAWAPALYLQPLPTHTLPPNTQGPPEHATSAIPGAARGERGFLASQAPAPRAASVCADHVQRSLVPSLRDPCELTSFCLQSLFLAPAVKNTL